MTDTLPEIRRVESSSVDAVGYDPARGTLYVRFLGSGHAYAYYDVPAPVYKELMASNSKGRFVNLHIKGAYEYRRL